jgi:hypothetical protein
VRRVAGLAAVLLSVLLLAAAGLLTLLTRVSVDLDLTPFKGRILEALSARSGLRLQVTGA